MATKLRIKVETLDDNDEVIDTELIRSTVIKKPDTLLNVGYRHSEQIEILQALQDSLLKQQSIYFREDVTTCPNCDARLAKKGYTKSDFNAVFTDHKVNVSRQYCTRCSWKSIPSILSLFGTTMHPDLSRLQCENGAKQTYRDAANYLNQLSCSERRINNHDRVKQTCEQVGEYMEKHPIACAKKVPPAKQLCLQVDGGHVAAKETNARSFEVLTSVVFKPENIDTTYHYEEQEDGELTLRYKRGTLTSKHCAASAKADKLKHIKHQTLLSAQKEGAGKQTHVTALCDGAKNCWQVVDVLEGKVKKITRILDWFHIGMKFQQISLQNTELETLAKEAKWYLWRGKSDKALERLGSIKAQVSTTKEKNKIKALLTYIQNNQNAIVNYEQRQVKGLIFTSQLAESTVESLINQRCKRQQHMRWTRTGLQPLMEIRALIASNDWHYHWEEIVCGATLRAA